MNELYHQMTLDEWAASKNRIREMIRKAKTAFIVIGYELRKIEEAEAYRLDGYDSLADFAKTEYGFEKTMTSRLIEVNKAFSEGGFSDILIEDAEGFTFTKLVEMKDIPREDLQLLRPDTKRDDIRELKRFESEQPEEGAPEGVDELLVEFFRKEKEALNSIFEGIETGTLQGEEEIAEIISPTGNKAFRKGMWMAFFYADSVKLKKKSGEILDWNYADLMAAVHRIFGEAAAGGKTWEKYFGEPEPAEEETAEAAADNVQEKGESVPKTDKNVTESAKTESERQKTSKNGNQPIEPETEGENTGGEKTEEEHDSDGAGEASGRIDGTDLESRGRRENEETGPAPDGSGEGEGSGGHENLPGEIMPPPEEPEEETAEERAVAPAQQGGETEEKETGHAEVDQLAESIDTWLEALTADIGNGKYRAALSAAERLCKDLKEMIERLKEKGR